jgi:hypothetical protein
MSQTIIDNIENYTFEIINGSLILTPKNNINISNIACNILKVDKTIIINDVKYIIKGVDKSFHNHNSLVITCIKENDNTNTIRMFCINKYQKLEVDDDNNIIFNFNLN